MVGRGTGQRHGCFAFQLRGKISNAVGDTPAKYVARVKMFQARYWIAHEGMRMATVASRLGYDSEASFSRAFKRIIGHPPSEARIG
nr:AraC family transcriptional regulator [Herminiimonas contaminans]